MSHLTEVPPTQVPLPSHLVRETHSVPRYCVRLPFNPGSRDQLMAYVLAQGHEPGKHRKTQRATLDEDTLEKLAKTKDPVYLKLLRRRELSKLVDTYIDGIIAGLGEDGRIHPEFTHRPSTFRLSCVSPNLQNIKKRDKEFAPRLRKCFTAAPGCVMIEIDLSGIEAVETGWFCGDPNYIRFAGYIHSLVVAQIKGIPFSFDWSKADLKMLHDEIKERYTDFRDGVKAGVHGTNYGETEFGLQRNEPDIFPTLAAAREVQDGYFAVATRIRPWHAAVRDKADRQGWLGGPGEVCAGGVGPHPFGYRHTFTNVLTYNRVKRSEWERHKGERDYFTMGGRPYKVGKGKDWNRVVAFYPQSTTAGDVNEAMLRLFNPDHASYIGDIYFGQTPLRAQIHDALLLESPKTKADRVLECVMRELTRPIEQQPNPKEWAAFGLGEFLTPMAEAKVGRSWGEMEEVRL